MINNKLLLLGATLLVANSLNAKTTICYKKSWETPSNIETTKLDGGECKGEKSLKEMKRAGWYIKDIEIKTAKKGLDYTYILSDINPVVIDKELTSKNDITTDLDIKNQTTKLYDVTSEHAKINIGNLKVGQSGVIQHTYKDGNALIISSAYVESSNSNYSIVKFIPFLDLKQNAIPTSNRVVANDDTFILNFMYDQSLLIAPNIDAFRATRKNFTENNFVHSDIFGAHLKSEYRPLPTQKMIQEFALSQNMGTIFIVIKSNLYILDSRTFTLLNKQMIPNISSKTQMPFYTRIEKIESNIFTSDIWSWLDFSAITKFLNDDRTEEEVLYGDLATKKSKDQIDYNSYYTNVLGLNNDKK
ncbi:MAG: plasminogen-binding N-terminal domain-containing protein [Arcobacter sp.]|uniref:plasminogen-binding N-terminal domain-containing protein n=1 Tax=Arcobacter sp. TaxID=1872629 RepID=UPI003C785F63